MTHRSKSAEMLTRTLHLQVLPNKGKLEDLRYSASRFGLYTQHFVTQLFFKPDGRSFSTAGMGQLANQGQHKARGIINAHRAATKATLNKTNVPQCTFTVCPAKIERAKGTDFDFWVDFETQFAKKRVRIPAKSHKRLNHWLARKWKIVDECELVLQKNGNWQVKVFIQKEVAPAAVPESFLGVDVGITNSVSRSDGYLGQGLSKIRKQVRAQNAERQRQGHAFSRVKSHVKQVLDLEVRRAITRCVRDGLGISVEDPKRLANLRSGSLHGWARSYFARRAAMVAEEESVRIVFVNPSYTSRTCLSCGNRDSRNRVKQMFKCISCGNTAHADINAARVIALEGSGLRARQLLVGRA